MINIALNRPPARFLSCILCLSWFERGYYHRALAIHAKALGPDHKCVAISLNNWAEFLRLKERDDEAESVYRQAIAIMEKNLSPADLETATISSNLATLLQRRSRFMEAESFMRQSLSIREKVLGKDHPDVLASRNSYVRLLHKIESKTKRAGLETSLKSLRE